MQNRTCTFLDRRFTGANGKTGPCPPNSRRSQVAAWGMILGLLALTMACGTTSHDKVPHSEKDFQQAFNTLYFNGKAKTEVPVRYGRIDLLTGAYAIEVDRVDKFHEGIGQALHYAKETGKKPGLALFLVHPDGNDLEKLDYVRRLGEYYGIRIWYINDELEKKRRNK